MSVVLLLGMLLAAAILPALAFSGFLIQRTNKAQQETIATLAEATVGAAAQTIDSQLEGMFTTLSSLAITTENLNRNNLEPLYRGAVRALDGTGTYFVVIDPHMNQLVNTRRPFGAQLAKATTIPPLRQAFATGEPQVSDAFFGPNAQKWVFSAILPWSQPGQEPLALVLTQDAETLSGMLSMETLRGGWNAAIIDNAGAVLASTFMSSDVGAPFFLNQYAKADAPFQNGLVHDGERYELITKSPRISNWRVVIWAKTDAVYAPIYRTFRLLLLGGLALISISGIAAWVVGRKLTKSVRQLSDDAQRLGAGREVPARIFPVEELSGVSAALSEAAARRKASENEIRFLMREVAHRSKNQMAVVASLAKQTALSSDTVQGFGEAFQQRLQGLARSTDLLIAGSVGGVDLAELIQVQVAPFQPVGEGRLSIEGPAFRLSSQAAQTLGLVFHEKATNASKYGAFSDDAGRLAINWTIDGENLELVWRETVKDAKGLSERRGFGTHLIDRVLGRALGADINRTFHADGLESRFKIPLAPLAHNAAS